MRKWHIIILGVTIGLVALYFHSCVEGFPFDISTTSPNGTYQIHLKEEAKVYLAPFPFNFLSGHGDSKVNLTTTKNGNPLIDNIVLYSGDGLDDRFLDDYPEHKWMSDSVLRFGHNVAKSEENQDSLSVSNNTDKTLEYLKIKAGDMLLVFEMPPKSKLKFQVPHQGWNSWVWADGEFTDERKPKGNGANFYHKDKLNEPLRYCVSVGDDAIKVESSVMDGYIDAGTSEKPNILKAANCDL